MSEQIFCQSCGMPMTEDAQFGREADGGKNPDYCSYCYNDGAFTADLTIEQMIETCLKYGWDPAQHGDKETARKNMREWFPSLKRWKA